MGKEFLGHKSTTPKRKEREKLDPNKLFQCDHQMTSLSKFIGKLQTGKKFLQRIPDKCLKPTIQKDT